MIKQASSVVGELQIVHFEDQSKAKDFQYQIDS
jgi:hypothetical protein